MKYLQYPPYYCQNCGAQIGYLGRLLNWLAFGKLHACKPDRILVDREGVAYPPVVRVTLKGKSNVV